MPNSVYWDACVFHALFSKEQGRHGACEEVIKDAKEQKIIIYTSAITYVECIRIKNEKAGLAAKKLSKENEQKLHDFFSHKWLRPVACDRVIGEQARALCWLHSALQPKDAIHVATAISIQVEVMHTYDQALLKLTGQIGNPALKIQIPPQPSQKLFPGIST